VKARDWHGFTFDVYSVGDSLVIHWQMLCGYHSIRVGGSDGCSLQHPRCTCGCFDSILLRQCTSLLFNGEYNNIMPTCHLAFTILGKTVIRLEWQRHCDKKVLVKQSELRVVHLQWLPHLNID
jgi:hypothetical protein